MTYHKTGLDERWGESQINGNDFIHWHGVLCGAVEDSRRVYGFMGVEMDSGDIVLINMYFRKSNSDFSDASAIFKDGLIPDVSYEGMLETMADYGKVISREQIANAILKSSVGTSIYFTSGIGGGDFEVEEKAVWEAMKTGEFLGSTGSSIWTYGNIGASDIFWGLVENQ